MRDLAEALQHISDEKAASADLTARVNRIIGDANRGVAFSIFYASVLTVSSVSMAPGPESGLRIYFFFFIFCVCLMIGYALWAVILYWALIWRTYKSIPFRVLNLSAQPLPALLRFNSRVVALTAWISTSAVGALAFSGYNPDPPIIIFSVFAFSLVAATYLAPIVPISNQLGRLKTQALAPIEAQIADHAEQLNTPGTTKPKGAEESFTQLITLRDEIEKVRTWPPGGQASVSAAAVATALPFLPSAIEYIPRLFE
ncbi:MAG: hypothetical protein AAGF53_05475 [Pseudomonadota bacterium]